MFKNKNFSSKLSYHYCFLSFFCFSFLCSCSSIASTNHSKSINFKKNIYSSNSNLKKELTTSIFDSADKIIFTSKKNTTENSLLKKSKSSEFAYYQPQRVYKSFFGYDIQRKLIDEQFNQNHLYLNFSKQKQSFYYNQSKTNTSPIKNNIRKGFSDIKALDANLLPQNVLTSLVFMEDEPIWYANDSYFINRGMELPSQGSRMRFLKNVFGRLAFYFDNGLVLHDGDYFLSELQNIRVSSATTEKLKSFVLDLEKNKINPYQGAIKVAINE